MSTDVKDLHQRSIDLMDAVKTMDAERVKAAGISLYDVNHLASRVGQLLSSATGSRSIYTENLRNAMKQKGSSSQFLAVAGVLQAFHLDVAQGYLVNLRHEAETVVVSEILGQAQKLSKTKGVHPAAAVLVACC